jgi:hypothetical protein
MLPFFAFATGHFSRNTEFRRDFTESNQEIVTDGRTTNVRNIRNVRHIKFFLFYNVSVLLLLISPLALLMLIVATITFLDYQTPSRTSSFAGISRGKLPRDVAASVRGLWAYR